MRLQIIILLITLLKVQPENIFSFSASLLIAILIRIFILRLTDFISTNEPCKDETFNSSLLNDEGWSRRAQLHFRESDRWIF